jgi:hypothetical protein
MFCGMSWDGSGAGEFMAMWGFENIRPRREKVDRTSPGKRVTINWVYAGTYILKR